MTNSLTNLEPLYVVDTNALIWYLSQDKRLSDYASDIFDAAERGETRLILSAIVIAELYYSNKKWGLFEDFSAVYNNELKPKPYFEFIPLLADDVLDFTQDAAIPEMHDRIIVGLARRFAAPVITSDSIITAAGVVPVAW